MVGVDPDTSWPDLGLLSVQQVAAILGVSAATIRRKIHAKELPATNIGGHGSGCRWRIKVTDLRAFLARHRLASDEDALV